MPSARLAKAVMCVLKYLAMSNKLDVFFEVELSDDVRRRLGYLAERCAQGKKLSSQAGQQLGSFGARLYKRDDSDRPPLTLMAKTNPTLLRLQAERADRVNERWNVLDT